MRFAGVNSKKNKLINSHLANAPHEAPFSNASFELRNRHWGWPNGTVDVLLLACRGLRTDCNDFFTFTLALIAEIPT